MKVKVGQHIYGRKEKEGFTTVGYSFYITKEDIRTIEVKCIYFLPDLYSREIEKPVKYVFYKLNKEDVVIGRGIYVGLDEAGRPGNYIFHNLIFQTKDITTLKINPIALIRYLESKGMFKMEILPNEKLEDIELDLELEKEEKKRTSLSVFKVLSYYIDENKLAELIYLCLVPETIKDPVIIEYEKDDELLDFLYDLFSILSTNKWEKISFNTLWYYSQEFKFVICGIRKDLPVPPSYSIKIDLINKTYESKIDIQNKKIYDYARLMVKMALTDTTNLTNLHLLEALVETGQWDDFIKLYENFPQDIKKIIYEKNKENILIEISDNGNVNLFKTTKENMELEDFIRVFGSKKFVKSIIEQKDEAIVKDFIEWIYNTVPENRSKFYYDFLNNLWLFELLIKKINEERKIKSVKIILELFEGFYSQYVEQNKYDELIEEKILDVFCDALEVKFISTVEQDKIMKILKKLPLSKNIKVLLLRALIRYKLGDTKAIISFLEEEGNRSLMYEVLREGIKTVDFERYKKPFQEGKFQQSFFRRLF